MKKQFDRFVLTDQLAQGPGGTLFGGDEKLPGGVTRSVTVKVLPPIHKADPIGEKRFVDEVRVLASLAGHPNVVTFYGMGLTEGTPWIAMEHVPATLADALGERPADVRDVARLVEHLAEGLSALHGLEPQLLHNRLQPKNVGVFAGNHFKVTEFGLAAPVTVEPTLGADSVRYAAPELLNKDFGRVGPATDLYALGHVAYEFALGGKLHRGQFPAVIDPAAKPTDPTNPAKWQAWHYSIPTNVTPAHEVLNGFPPGLGAVIAKLMAKPLGQRYATAADVLADLRAGAGMAQPMTSAAPAGAAHFEPPPLPVGGRGFARTPPPQQVPRTVPPPMPAAGAPAPAAPARAAPLGAPSGNERYYVKLRNQTSGPFDLGTLQRMARQGQLSRLHQLSTDGRTWKGAGTVEGIFG